MSKVTQLGAFSIYMNDKVNRFHNNSGLNLTDAFRVSIIADKDNTIVNGTFQEYNKTRKRILMPDNSFIFGYDDEDKEFAGEYLNF